VVSVRAREGDIVWLLNGDTYTPIILLASLRRHNSEGLIPVSIYGYFHVCSEIFREILHRDFVGESFVDDYMRWLSYRDSSSPSESAYAPYVIFALH
jgi:hypothetical protein